MKAIVIFYSFTGKTKVIAQKKATEFGADLIEVKEATKRSVLAAYTVGCYQAMRQKKVAINPIDVDFNAFDKIVIVMPIWASAPAPVFNNVVEMLPSGKQVELIMTSGSGNSNREKAISMIKANGCEVTDYFDIKS